MTENYYQRVTEAALAFQKQHPGVKAIMGSDFEIEPADMIVAYSTKVDMGNGEYMKVNTTTPEARPPFEWLIEVSTTDEHFLLFENQQLKRAVRKELFDVTPAEAESLLKFMGRAQAAL